MTGVEMMTKEIEALLAKAQTDEATARALRARLRRALDMIVGRWKLEILWLLNQRMHRFGELRRGLSGVTQHMLTIQLRELEADGLIKRTIYAEVPPRVEYEITPYARTLRPVFFALLQWSQENPPRSMRKAAD
jgi:DNA-binding HxlR family transcriptional regulator